MICSGSDSKPRGQQRRGFSIIIDGVESVNQQRCITGTSRCMQGNFSPAPWEEEEEEEEEEGKQLIAVKAADVWTDPCDVRCLFSTAV